MTLIAITLLLAALAAWAVCRAADLKERQLERRNLRRLLEYLNK